MDFETLFNEQKFGDVTIAVDGKEFLAYKGILASRSLVLAAMFEHRMLEKEQNRIVITDVGHTVIKEMLIYIYTGRSPSVWSMSNDLLIVADKYELDGLKIMCVKKL